MNTLETDQKVKNISEVKQLRHYYKYYKTTLELVKYNFDYETEYVNFIRIRLNEIKQELSNKHGITI